MIEDLVGMLGGATLGLALVLLLRRSARRAFGADAAFTLWLLPPALAVAPLLPRGLVPPTWSMGPVLATPHFVPAGAFAGPAAVDWQAWLVAAWAGGAAIGLLRLGFHYLRLLRAARPLSGPLLGVLRAAAPGLDPRRVRMHHSGPAVLWALPRAWLLVPADFAERFEHQGSRELVLHHELVHLRRGDVWSCLAMELACALLWFHPLAWLARSRFRLDQELACDAASLRARPGCAAGYARALLDSVAVQPAAALIPWLAEPQLKERIAMISRNLPGALRRRSGLVAVVALLCAGTAWVAGGNAARAAAPASSTQPPAVDITYKNRNPPHYPEDAARRGEQGRVMLRVTVDASGDVAKVEVDPARTTAPPDLQEVAVAAASNWKFRPGRKHGHAVGGVVAIPVDFSLGGHPCPAGFEYRPGQGGSFTCTPGPAEASS